MKSLVINIILFISLVFGGSLSAQNLSPLIPFQTNNPLIERPEVFRELQIEIDKKLKNTKSGLRLNYVYGRMELFKESFEQKLELAQIVDGNKKIKVGSEEIELDFTDNSFPELISNIHEQAQIRIGSLLNNIIKNSVDAVNTNEEIKKAFLYTFSKFINGELQLRGETINFANNNFVVNEEKIEGNIKNEVRFTNTEKLNEEISGLNVLVNELVNSLMSKYLNDVNKFRKFISEKMDENMEDFNADEWCSIRGKKESQELFARIIRDYINDKLLGNFKSIIYKGFDKVESKITDSIKGFDKWLTSVNIGLSVSEGEGNFQGGIQLLFTAEKWFQFGGYINDNISSGENSSDVSEVDSSIVPRSLFGFQFRVAPLDFLQIDGLMSSYFGDNNFKGFKSYEMGVGATVKAFEKLLIGVSVYRMSSISKVATLPSGTRWTWGLFIKPAIPNTPALFLGASKLENADSKFGIELAYPINTTF